MVHSAIFLCAEDFPCGALTFQLTFNNSCIRQKSIFYPSIGADIVMQITEWMRIHLVTIVSNSSSRERLEKVFFFAKLEFKYSKWEHAMNTNS